jgi:hypothetical protein
MLPDNPRSRASKRAASPSLDLDKSLKSAPRATDATPVLAARPNAGISKTKRKQKPMKRGQRARQEKGLARAEAVMDQLEKKKALSQVKLKRVRGRRAVWDEVNGEAREEVRKAPKFQVLANGAVENEDAADDDEAWEDENGDADMKPVEVIEVPVTELKKLVVADHIAADIDLAAGLDEVT